MVLVPLEDIWLVVSNCNS